MPADTDPKRELARRSHPASRLVSEYGMVFVLVLLCAAMCLLTIQQVHPNGSAAGSEFAADIERLFGTDEHVLAVAGASDEDLDFTKAVALRLNAFAAVNGGPREARQAIVKLLDGGQSLDLVACNHTSASWQVWDVLRESDPRFKGVQVVKPKSYLWPSFLSASNLFNVVNNAAVFAIIGIGMTLVIITGGIDLSVGSLVALAAVVCTMLIRDVAGGPSANGWAMAVCCLAAIGVCALLGAGSGMVVLTFHTRPFVVPPFIMTLAMMMIARGLAYAISGNETIPAADLPAGFNRLGGGNELGPIPNPIVLMLALFLVAHIVMSRTTLGRYIYAVGGNAEAARLSGVPVKRVLLFVYTLCGVLSGLGGVVLASRLSSGSAQYGQMYELHVIAAVVVGGTSLSGGEGKVFGTLVGALIIAVVQSGLNQRGISGREQDLVTGLIILAAVLLDMLNKRGWRGGG